MFAQRIIVANISIVLGLEEFGPIRWFPCLGKSTAGISGIGLLSENSFLKEKKELIKASHTGVRTFHPLGYMQTIWEKLIRLNSLAGRITSVRDSVE